MTAPNRTDSSTTDHLSPAARVGKSAEQRSEASDGQASDGQASDGIEAEERIALSPGLFVLGLIAVAVGILSGVIMSSGTLLR